MAQWTSFSSRMEGVWDATHVTSPPVISGEGWIRGSAPKLLPQTAAFPLGLQGDALGVGAAGPPPLSPHNLGLGLWCLFWEAKGGAGKLVVGDDPARC